MVYYEEAEGDSRVSSGRVAAFFDYDNTLVHGDSLWPFLKAAAGPWRAGTSLVKALAGWPRVVLRGGDGRTYVKARLLRELLRGKRFEDLEEAIEGMAAWPREKEPATSALRDHHAKGHHVVIVSGSLDIYLSVLLAGLPHNAVLCTEMEVDGDRLTGNMRLGNCVRARKAELVRDYIERYGPFDDTFGYGNIPHDVPMLELMNHKIVV